MKGLNDPDVAKIVITGQMNRKKKMPPTAGSSLPLNLTLTTLYHTRQTRRIPG